MEQLKLTDLVSGNIIEEIQKIFIEKNGIESGLSCADGSYITSSCNINPFCELHIKKSKEGKRRCDQCDCANGERACREGQAISYTCHAGLVDFTAPVIVEGKQMGFMVGGQVSTKALTREETDALAQELGLDQDALYEASKEIAIVTDEQIKQAVVDANRMSKIIS